MDADAIPLQDPEILFDTTSYKNNGNLFWGDFWNEAVPFWSFFDLPNSPWPGAPMITEEHIDLKLAPPPKHDWPRQAETGMVLIDKVKYWQVLEWLLFLNSRSHFVYKLTMGDKDTFRIAFELAGLGSMYSQSSFGPSLPLTDLGPLTYPNTEKPNVRYRCLGMLQLHPDDGSPLFHHRTADAKLTPRRKQPEYTRTITHLTPPVTQDQASIMNFAQPGVSIYRSGGMVAWGLHPKDVRLFPCESLPVPVKDMLSNPNLKEYDLTGIRCLCPPVKLHTVYSECIGLSEEDIFTDPSPIAVIEVPKDSYVHQVSELELEAIKHIPFKEDLSLEEREDKYSDEEIKQPK